ncbi:hypothetical protein TNIN_5381 [Trichonephila inaurata madagascariensis]|uniref:Uncharacterized protein n=1 Tax=Trichonephila inaurata madagascariensis TaxID=2747483 RepID=A0A8X6YT92_9ARAC|nr:hypothetical protein TNIN_5381 [Trichonephila inaurata madagascariensis]
MRPLICISLLLLGLACPALSASCPEEDLPSTCECESEFVEDEVDLELSCTGSDLSDVKQALRQLGSRHRLHVSLDEVNIGTLDSRFFEGFNLVKLEISHCEVDSLAEEGAKPLTGLENSLQELEITASLNDDNGPIKLDLSHLLHLTELDLSFNSITDLGNDVFEQDMPSLTNLILSNNGIEKLGDRAFANLRNLRLLWLDGNRFGAIKRSMLPNPASRLQDLQLDNNAFTDIPDDLFTQMPELQDVSLRTNGITQMRERTYKPVWSHLEVLDIRGNPLQCDSHIEWMFDNLPEDLSLSGRCEGPKGREGYDLYLYIVTKG